MPEWLHMRMIQMIVLLRIVLDIPRQPLLMMILHEFSLSTSSSLCTRVPMWHLHAAFQVDLIEGATHDEHDMDMDTIILHS